MAIKVSLRQKPISGERLSLYLDFYPAIPHPETGKLTRREFLGMYVNEKAKYPIDKQNNEETKRLAEQIRQKRENNLNKPEIYSGFEKEQLRIKEKGEKNFVEYFRMLADKKKGTSFHNWNAAYKYLADYSGGVLKFCDINESQLTGFKEYLLSTKSTRSSKTRLATNSAWSYFNKVKASLKQAYKDGFLQTDINVKINPIKQAETRRNFLTIDELGALARTECNNPELKRAALFSALTGLRFSDIVNLNWGNIQNGDEGYFLVFSQQKTKGIERHPISEQAAGLLGEPQAPAERVFELKYSAHQNRHLKQWVNDAGIFKPVTFHSFRHSYATIQLTLGTDIYTISKLLGHKDLKTTQIYAKIIDETKRKAADRMQIDFNL